MAQTNYTPIQLYYSSTASAVPVNTNLASGELAINITDGLLFYKDNAGTVQKIGYKLTPTTAGGTGLTSFTANGIVYASSTSALATNSALTFDGTNFGVGLASPGCKVDVLAASNTSLSPTVRVYSNNLAVNTAISYDGIQGSGDFYIGSTSNSPVIFKQSNTEQMRLTSTSLYTASGINVGIGTSSPQSRLEVRQDQSGAITRVIANNNFANTGAGSSFDYYFGTTRLGGLTHAFAASGAYLGFDVWSGSAATQRMLLDGSGNLGIGTSSPAYKLDVNGTARFNNTFDFGGGQSITSGSGSYRAAKFGAASGAYNVLFSGSTALSINDNADTINLLVLTNGGNLGLGVTPSAWSVLTPAMQFGTTGFVAGRTTNPEIYFGTNAYYNGSAWKYITSNVTTLYAQDAGTHKWYLGASGTAGNTITFTQAMTLDASGNLVVGATSAGARFQVTDSSSAAATALMRFVGQNNYQMDVQSVTSSNSTVGSRYNFVVNSSNGEFSWSNSGGERARIDSSGNLGIGTSSPSQLLHLSKSSGDVISLAQRTSPAGNFFVGHQATDGYNTVRIGLDNALTAAPIGTTTNFPVAFYTNNTERARIDSSGNLGIAQTDPTNNGVSGYNNLVIGNSSSSTCGLTFKTTTSGTPYPGIAWSRGAGSGVNGKVYYDQSTDRLYCQAGGSGGVYLAGGGTSWTSASDERVKDIIEPIENATQKLANWRTVIGKYKSDTDGVRRSFLIAQDVLTTFPEAVNTDKAEEYGLNYQDLIPLLVASIQELKAEFDAYKASHP